MTGKLVNNLFSQEHNITREDEQMMKFKRNKREWSEKTEHSKKAKDFLIS